MLQRLSRLLACAALSFVAVQSAAAADLPLRAINKAPAMVNPAWVWSGFYVGIHGGFGGDRTRYPFEALGTPGDLSLTSSGFFGGGQIGYNWRLSGNWLFGLEADIAWSDIKSELTASVAGLGSLSAGTKLDWFGTARARLGYTWDRFMVFGTGGFAYGRTNTTLSVPGLVNFSQNNDKTGWAAGAGFEYMVTPTFSVKTEYLYIDLGTNAVFSAPGIFSISEDTTAHTVKVGLNWKLGSRWY